MDKEIVNPAGAPPAVGAYSPALKMGNILFISGQIDQSESLSHDVSVQTEMAIKNIIRLLEAKNLSLDDIGMVNVYLPNINDFEKMNDVYMKYFKKPYPARVTVEAKLAEKDLLVEISAIAVLK